MYSTNSIYKALFDFLEQHCEPSRPVLLALSGGPDSLALLHLLCQYKQSRPLKLGIAHVDHGWRNESAQEALILEQKAAAWELPFHLRKLQPEKMEGNLEAACREARLRFFSELCQKYHYQAVILGHHAGDQIETVLKRIFEGSPLPNLGGLKEVALVEGVTLWRPWLKFPKQKILNFIESANLTPFLDSTNQDPRFLRGRMRTSILPFLTKEFGKEIESAIVKLGEDAKELSDYLEFRLQSHIPLKDTSQRGNMLDLSCHSLHAFEIKHLIRKICLVEECFLSREQVETAAWLILNKAADKTLMAGSRVLHIDRGYLFLEKFTPAIPHAPLQLRLGNSTYGDWDVEAKPANSPCNRQFPHWKDVWKGDCKIVLPEGDYYLAPPKKDAVYPGSSSINRWWTNAKVPAFLRASVPLICQGDRVKAEFLSGKNTVDFLDEVERIVITLTLKMKDRS